jgi:hypothetical protein
MSNEICNRTGGGGAGGLMFSNECDGYPNRKKMNSVYILVLCTL